MIGDDVLRGERVVLRQFRTDDAADLAAGCDDPLTSRFLPLLPSPYTREDALWWITVGAPAELAAGGVGYAFADPVTDRVLGGGGLRPIRHGATELGYWIGPWARGRGIATEATQLMARHAFERGAQRIRLSAQHENGPSQRVALAAGFTREGVERGGGLSRDGSRHDLVIWARLDSDPDAPSPRLLPDLPGGSLTDGVVTLRPLGPQDAADTHALRSLPDVVATSVPPRIREFDEIRRTCERSESGWLAGQRADFTIRDAETDTYAGEIGLYYWEPSTSQAMIGYSLLPAWRGRGFTTRAVRLVAAWGFDEVGLVRVIAGTEPSNLASQRVLERAGFEREGYSRQRLPGPDGTRIDDITWALVSPS